MGKKSSYLKSVCIVFAAIICMSPMLASASSEGHDWYCSDADAHKQYEQHLKLHLNHSAEDMAEKLDQIYSNQELSQEEKKVKMLSVLDAYLLRMKAGMGD
jgi:acetone carboxylase gamma subunit